jgi:hypothetical protein
MEPSSWLEHFRNRWTKPARLAYLTRFGDDKVRCSRCAFCWPKKSARRDFAQRDGARTRLAEGGRKDAVSRDFIFPMHSTHPTRRGQSIRRWLSFCALVSLALPALGASASSSTSADSAPSSSSSSSKAQSATQHHSASTSASKTSAQKSSAHKSSAASTTGTRSTASSRRKKSAKKSARKRGQQVIDAGRAREIQQALIREHYLTGEPSGTWDSATQAAMQRYQEDQGWQSKTTPDSRALIKLGLGPNQDHLLNPESAMTSARGSASPVDPKAETKPAPAASAVPQQ